MRVLFERRQLPLHPSAPKARPFVLSVAQPCRTIHPTGANQDSPPLRSPIHREVIRRASPDNFTPSTRRFLDDIAAHCNSCQRMAPKPFVFQVTMPDNIVFNHEIYLDLMWIEKRPHPPILHIVHRGTHFSASTFLKSENAVDVWSASVTVRVSYYIGFHSILTHAVAFRAISSPTLALSSE